MDRPLPDRDSRRGPPPRRSRPPTYPRDNPRDNPRQNRKDERQDLDNDWVHDRYDDEPESRGNQSRHRGGRRDDHDRRSPPRQDNRDRDRDRDRDRERDYGRDRDREPDRRDRDRNRDRDDSGRPAPPPAKIRVDNLHYDLNEDDLEDLFTRIAPVRDVKLQFDRAGRSEGTAFVTYDHIADARTAVKEFDGANAKGQPIRLSILPLPPRSQRNPFDRAENPRSLFDRIDAPSSGRGRRRSESPMDGVREYSRNNSTRGGINGRRTDSARGGDDRFPPRGGRGRGGERGGRPPREPRDGPRPGAKPRKTQEELDAEMDDYWKGTTNEAPAAVSKSADDDIDMIT